MKTLKEIYSKYSNERAGKGGDKGTLHSYIDYYENLFAVNDIRSKANRVLEIGVHTGHSLAMWKEYFHNAEVIGVELNAKRIDRKLTKYCTVIVGDATKPETFMGLDNIDIVIDDGSHRLDHQVKTFNILASKMNSPSIYCIEDVLDYNRSKETLLGLHSRHEIHDGREATNNPSDVIVTYFL